MNQTLIDNLRYVLQNMRLQKGKMAKVQADIVAQAISEIELMSCRIKDGNVATPANDRQGNA